MHLNKLVKELALESLTTQFHSEGRVIQINGSIIQAELPTVSMFALCEIERLNTDPLHCQVVGFSGSRVQLAPLGRVDGIQPNARVFYSGAKFSCTLPAQPMGCVMDPLGQSIDPNQRNKSTGLTVELDLRRTAPAPLDRKPIKEIFVTGVRALDALFTIGRGQRIAILAGPGSGKSTLVGMIARNSTADVIVIGLIGERGREVQHFLNSVLGAEGLKKSVVVVATSDQPPLCRQLAANSATAIAEYYRDQGKNVLLILDSITRYARALREVSLAAGEPPIRQGFTPAVFTEIPALLERAGNNRQGSITAIYTVLTQSDISADVLTEELTSILDGHIILSDSLVGRGIHPAIDPCKSLSRLASDLLPQTDIQQIKTIQGLFHTLATERDLVSLGGQPSKLLQKALKLETELLNFINQLPDQAYDYTESRKNLMSLAHQANCIAD